MTPLQYSIVKADGEDAQSFVTVYVPGKAPLVADSSHPSYDQIVAKAKAGDASVADLFDAAAAAGRKFMQLTERISAKDGQIFLDGEPMNNALAEQIVRALREGRDDWKPFVRFYENVQQNLTEHSRENLYRWLAAEDFTIDDDGMIVGYKSVYRDGKGGYKSVSGGTARVNGVEFTGKIPQRVGDVVEMPRSAVTHNPAASCSYGLHVGTHGYAANFSGDALLKVIVNPRDVVSVPTADSGSKMRVCRYRVAEEIKVRQAKVASTVVKATKTKGRGKAKTAADAILGALGRRKVKGITAAAIAAQTGLKLETTRTTLSRMKKDGLVKVSGSEGQAGLYVRAS
jgi:hypothetical protein